METCIHCIMEAFDGASVLQWALVAIAIYPAVILYYDGHNILNSMRSFRGTRESVEHLNTRMNCAVGSVNFFL